MGISCTEKAETFFLCVSLLPLGFFVVLFLILVAVAWYYKGIIFRSPTASMACM